MITCKNCLHYEPCRDTYYNDEEQTRIPFGFLEKDGVDKDCAFFKDRSKIIELPCNVKEEIWVNLKAFADIPNDVFYKYKVQYINVYRCELFDVNTVILKRGKHKISIDNFEYFKSLFGKCLFYTKEEAEQALKEREINGNI